jgi:hypothetical protein
MADGFPLVVNSDVGLINAVNVVTELYNKNRWITITDIRIGADRSLDQNALFHVFLTDAAAYYLSKHKKDVTPTEIESMKLTVKRHFYAETAQAFMVEEVQDIWRHKSKVAYTSSKRWKRGEMYMVLEWFQAKAARDGLVLEAIGEYARLKRGENK